MIRIEIPSELQKVNEIFKKHNFKAYLVGGAVRDNILGKPLHDWDLATDAKPEDVMKIFNRVIPTGIAHGTVTIHIFNKEIETTTFRTESSYTDGRHPDSVSFSSNLEDDLSRRDFTMNAIAADLDDGKLIDPFNGQNDIKKGIIRTVGNAKERFSEDGLRPVRAIRFSGQLGFKIEEETLSAIKDPRILKKTSGISYERFRDEFCKMLMTEKPSVCLKLLEECGILDIFIPEFKACRFCTQKDDRGFHEFDVADHIFYATDGAPKDNLTVRLAAFYHDIGKPESKTTEVLNGKLLNHFHGHECISEKKCIASMTALKFSNEEIKKVSHLVKEHMFYYQSEWSDAAVRRFIVRVGRENTDDLILLRLADIYGKYAKAIDIHGETFALLEELKERIKKTQESHSALSLKDLKVNGKDLINEGIPAGPVMGKILAELFENVMDCPQNNEKEKLLDLAKTIYSSKFSS